MVRDSQKEILAAVDIKTADLNEGEVGYWATSEKPGVMTAAVKKLSEIAKEAGYKKLYALVRFTNDKSSAVITRAGFQFIGKIKYKENNELTHDKYELEL